MLLVCRVCEMQAFMPWRWMSTGVVRRWRIYVGSEASQAMWAMFASTFEVPFAFARFKNHAAVRPQACSLKLLWRGATTMVTMRRSADGDDDFLQVGGPATSPPCIRSWLFFF